MNHILLMLKLLFNTHAHTPNCTHAHNCTTHTHRGKSGSKLNTEQPNPGQAGLLRCLPQVQSGLLRCLPQVQSGAIPKVNCGKPMEFTSAILILDQKVITIFTSKEKSITYHELCHRDETVPDSDRDLARAQKFLLAEALRVNLQGQTRLPQICFYKP